MCPVHEFRDNFDQTAPANHDQPDGLADTLTLHEADSTVRNLCLVWADGRKAFFNYAYLMAGDLVLEDNLNILVLSFSGHIITLKGYRLDTLFDLLLKHSPQIITTYDIRYSSARLHQHTIVTEILVRSE